MARNIYLIGFSGTGKSSVARCLASRLGWTYFDTDSELVRRFGKPIDRVFAEDGEPAFRSNEREVVAWTACQNDHVVSLGGGAFVDRDSRRLVQAHHVVRLAASPEEILRRLASDDTEVRPLLEASDPLGRIRELLARREAIYAEAHLTIDTEGLTPEEVAERVLAWRSSLGEAQDGASAALMGERDG